jgi:WXG100 family type VII secretion target
MENNAMALLKVTPEQLDQLATRFTQEAQSVQTVMSSIESTVAGTDWEGSASGKFQQEWQAYRQHLQRLNQALNETSQAVRKQATAYRAVDGQ